MKASIEKTIKRIEVTDDGNLYNVAIETDKGNIVNFPVAQEIRNYGDIVAFTDGTVPNKLTKQEWINLYIEATKK